MHAAEHLASSHLPRARVENGAQEAQNRETTEAAGVMASLLAAISA